jgi:hypothetical protein
MSGPKVRADNGTRSHRPRSGRWPIGRRARRAPSRAGLRRRTRCVGQPPRQRVRRMDRFLRGDYRRLERGRGAGRVRTSGGARCEGTDLCVLPRPSPGISAGPNPIRLQGRRDAPGDGLGGHHQGLAAGRTARSPAPTATPRRRRGARSRRKPAALDARPQRRSRRGSA